MEFNIERVLLCEISEVAQLFDAYRVFYGKPTDLALAKEFLTERLQNHESVVFMAKDNQGIPVGFTQLYPSFSSVSAMKTWILNDLFVSEHCRGSGVGKALLNAAKDHALLSGSIGIALETAHDNLGAQGLYESLGYKKDTHYFSYFLTLPSNGV